MSAPRPVRVGDLSALVALDAESFPRPWGEAGWAGALARPGAWIRVVPDPGAAGRLLAALCGWFAVGEGEILRVMTRPEVRRRGLAGDLVAGFCTAARRAGAERLFLEVDAGNHAARALYAKHGFVAIGRRPGYYAPHGGDALVLERAWDRLAGPT